MSFENKNNCQTWNTMELNERIVSMWMKLQYDNAFLLGETVIYGGQYQRT